MEINLSRGLVRDIVRVGVYPFEEIARNKKIGISYDESKSGKEYLFDVEKIQKVFSILLSYAIENTPVGAEIYFTKDYSTSKDGYTDFIFIIEDSDTSSTSDKLSLLFNRSEKVDTNLNSYDEHSNSLAFAVELVELMGGMLTAKSKLNKGTIFTLQLPLKIANYEDVPFYAPALY